MSGVRTGRPTGRTIRMPLLLVPMFLLAVAGCADGEEKERIVEENNSIGAGIADELAARDDVASAEVRYVDTFTVPKSTTVDITMEPGADMQQLYDEGLRLVWQSEINPLSLLYVSVINPQDPPSGISETIDVDGPGVRADLEEKYGPHPD
ncbi:hypothetical protein DQ237_14400 [Blastococcus sp. TF02-8]|uniref:hypothetical protein n=1 Tax=Blastococcus sp. TF02-8 TaxID=2250574 RepID=UPI000DE83824|nr:hypothetical protein [Blastococcus sp. TF02-8]RBY95267.1 hypothetical protein DQ237_14400 [Blastococcus sp. TF02-8]